MYEEREVHATVTRIHDPSVSDSCISVIIDGDDYSTELWLMNNIVYKLPREPSKTECACGASHTSNPKFHLSYCPLNSIPDKE